MVRLEVGEETGQINIAGTEFPVSAKPLGNPDFIYLTNTRDQADSHIFVRYERTIRDTAPERANGYSTALDWSLIHELGRSNLPSGEDDKEFLIPVQYYEISKSSINSLLKS